MTKKTGDEIEILLKQPTEETREHLEITNMQITQLWAQDIPLADQDKHYWCLLDSTKVRCEEDLACLAEVSMHLVNVRSSNIETVLQEEHKWERGDWVRSQSDSCRNVRGFQNEATAIDGIFETTRSQASMLPNKNRLMALPI